MNNKKVTKAAIDIKMSISSGKPITGKYSGKMNIGNLLIEASENQKDKGILFIQNNDEIFLTYEQLLEKAIYSLGKLQKSGLKRDDFAILSFENNIDFAVSFWACILGGIIPAPITPPSSFKEKNASLEKLINVWNTLKKPVIISDDTMICGIENNDSYSDCKDMLMLNISVLRQSTVKGSIDMSTSDKPALIQFSSGSTNTPKGVILTHKNLLTNIEGIIDAAGFTSEDRFLSWMPYYHDMGLIGCHLTLIALGMFQINMHPVDFVKRPTRWFDLIVQHKISLTSSPNFGYRLLLKKITDKHLATWDLSRLRLIFNGAEPISIPLIREFMDKLAICKLPATSMFLVYGMAEACLAVTFPTTNTRPESHCISRNSLITNKVAKEVSENDVDSFYVASEGYPVPGMEVRIVDENGEIVVEKQLGEIQIKGDNVTSGYIYNPEATSKFFQDDWLKTGDTGFMIEGKLCVTGRIKDIIFVNGQNFFAHDIEFKLEEFEGVEPGKIVVCGWHDEVEGREKVAIFSALRVHKDKVREFYANILRQINESFGIAIEYVVLTKIIPKTTSGKVQRFVLIKSFLNNEYDGKIFTSDELLFNMVAKSEKVEPDNILTIGKNADKIREIWGQVLDKPIESLGYNQTFLSLGGTSIKAVQVLGMLEDDFKLTLSHDILINCKTINDMAEYIRVLPKVNTSEINAAKTTPSSMNEDDDIAVIEMSCRFPDASSPEEFWDNLATGKCSINEIPEDRWDINQYYSPSDDKAKTNCRTGAFIDNVFDFDAKLFNISDEEASVMDPQQRIILELVFEILERAGYSKKKISGRSLALFIGASTNAYYEYHLNTLKMLNLKSFDSVTSLTSEQQESILKEWKNKFGVTDFHPNLLVDNILNMIAARASQEFNLKGPSIVVDTACSSSIVTIHMACESLKRGECDIAIAGGINLLLTPTPYIYLSNAGALSTSGVSSVFDAKADGLVPGEGAGLVLLKPLKKAIADKDKVLAIIKASAINNDGHSIGVMAPNPDGQRSVIESLYAKNDFNPKDIQYVEAHGTGTKIGDPSEVRALDSAFKRWSPKPNSIAIGSVKANIGHLLNSAGIASFIKVVLALNNKIMPPNVNLTQLNPSIKFNKTPFYTISKAKEWTVDQGISRRASINSFGFGGTNCHMVVEEAPKLAKTISEKKYERSNNLICLSANTKGSLEQKIDDLVGYLKTSNGNCLGDVCYTENVSRTLFKYRCSVVSESCSDLLNKLKEIKLDNEDVDKSHKIALMFTGQGSQYVGIARELYEHLPIFRGYIEECSQAFYPYLNEKLTDLIYSDKADKMILAQTNITQPVVFAIDYAFGKLLIDLGVKPDYMIGHSIGEWSAACLSGVVSLQDAAKIVASRGKLMHELQSSGGMCAVFTSGDKLEQLLKAFDGSVWIAAYNGTHQVISGELTAIEKFTELLFSKEIGFKILDVSQAFHTPLMNPILDEFRGVLEGVTFNSPKIPIVSNVTGELMTKSFDTEYWIQHILSPVKFEQSLKYLSDNLVDVLIECGPDRVLAGIANGIQICNTETVLFCANRKKNSFETCLEALGSLFSLGLNIDFEKFEEGIYYDKVQLPLYPFQRNTYKPDFGMENIKVPSNWFYNWSWIPEPPKLFTSFEAGNIIIFDDGNGLSEEFESMFDSNKNRVYVVSSGTEYSYDSNKKFIINPLIETDYIKLFKEIQGPITAVIHLWNFKGEHFKSEFVFDDKVLYDDIYSILLIGKAIEKIDSQNVKLLIATNGAIAVDDSYKILNPHQGIAVTLALALDQENDFINSYCIDIDKKEYKSNKELAQTLFNEMRRELNTEGIVAIRDGARYVRDLVNTHELNESSKIVFNEGETYLITGGLSPVGGEIAKAFAKKAKINLVLTGRSKLPLRVEWNKEISDKHANKIKLILNLEELGANVTYETVDVTKIGEMKNLIKKVNDVYGPIHGIIHAAGSWDSSTFKLIDKEIDTINKVIQPKVQGAVITDFVTRKEPLKFFVMISSVSCSQKAWSAGIGDYAAANSFLPAYSYYRDSVNAPGKTISLNYSLWSKTGMGSDLGDIALNAIKAQGLNPLPKGKAVEALMRVLSDGNQRVIHIIDKIQLAQEKSSSQIKVSSSDFKKSKNTRETVYGVIAEQLKVDMENLDKGQNFVDLGLDSLGAVKVMESLRQNLGIELYPTLIFEYQTPDSLAQYIEKLYSTGSDEVASAKMDVSYKNNNQNENIKDIAIIGASVRIPGANTLDEYWNILETGKCEIREVPKGRWTSKDYFSTDVNSSHTSYTKHGGFIDKPYDFDPLFFGMSPSEATVTDPQQRIFLEVAWEALEQAGYGGRYKSKSIGVFVGCEQSTYEEHFANYRTYMELKNDLLNNKIFNNINDMERKGIMASILNVLQPAKMVPDAVAGNSLNEVAARVSHCLDLTGPSLTINSACSSSLSALHLACESIRTGDSQMAIAGGVNLNLSPTPYVGLSRISALSKTGICYPFDGRADGMVLSEGSSAILLKPLVDAILDKDNIMAVIKGSAIDNDGHSQGITAPRPEGQAEAIRKAYQSSNVNPETVSYVETHGTGTPLGDPIEIEGLTHAFQSFTSKKGFCAVGSVKSSVGHMLSASGITSLIKVVLALENKTIPYTINYNKLNTNPNIDFDNSPFYVASEKPIEWKCNNLNPLRAGVNAFGFGGTNVHVVLEEAPVQMEYEEEKPPYLLQLTGRNKNVMKRIATNLKNHIKENQDLSVASICFTMNNAQKELSTKSASIVRSREHLLEVLTSFENGESIEGTFDGRSNPNRETQAYLILDGNLEITKDNKHELCMRFVAFNTAYKQCTDRYEIYKNHSNFEDKRIEAFATEYALGVLLSSFDLKIYGMIAQGTGIAAAAVLTGLITLDQAIKELTGNSILENTIDKGDNNAVYLNCPILTPTGVVEDVLDISINVEKNIKDLNEFVIKNQVVIYPGNINEIKNSEFYDAKLFNWVDMNINDNPVESIITVFAKLYTLGSRYNPSKLFSVMEKKVPLPTYPFENETYKVTLQEEYIASECTAKEVVSKGLVLDNIEKKGLLKIDTNYTLSDIEKESNCKDLANDLKK
ncbi:type I polyketide synthase [Clostridium estertheticum]|uniref:Polyketide synthase n=1 Tax=Clostridium estertheticum subsp. estertheticum TaxID=1552 RepID=A0A1J0GGX4_9CLOT|nr:type I polyketide synthase [Clostridium estertheticum]APC40563.1 polyketide synthase [Clostridium estertheticum subsp. estertheticum]MBZ9617617.1 type I polyketide synthase [Clostridium estertheticum subsp. laramiense]WAG73290.1 type I polyketide synthase [Clostridium estertheticum]